MKLIFSREINKEIAVFDHDGRQYRIPRRINNDRYEVIDLLAVGGVGIIFIAMDTQLKNKKVLIKRCLYRPTLFEHRNDINRTREIPAIRNTIKIEHAAMMHGWARRIPSIPIPLDKFDDINPDVFGPHKDLQGGTFTGEPELYKTEPYLVITYFTGYPIKSDHSEVRKNVVGFTLFFIRNTANILKRFHREYAGQKKAFDFFYCDLKPDNVLLTNDKQVVLIDMGSFAVRVDGNLSNDITTTLGYRAPELKNQQAMFLSPAVDVYTLAVCAFELITGNRPKLDPNENLLLDWDTFKKTVESAKAFHWETVFRKALEINPSKRYQTMQEFLDALAERKTQSRQSMNKFQYVKKKCPNSVIITPEWFADAAVIDHAGQSGEPFVCIDAWSPKTYFDVEASIVRVNSRIRHDDMQQGLVHDLFDRSKKNLIQNITFFPELIAISQDDTLVVHMPDLSKGKVNDSTIIKRRLEAILYLFMNLSRLRYRMIGISNETIQFDPLNRPFIVEFWLALNATSGHISENPMIHDIFKSKVIIPPETKLERKWNDEVSFSYLAGIATLLMIEPMEVFDLYSAGNLYEKQHFESFVKKLNIDMQLKEIILSLINPVPAMRSKLYESVLKIKKPVYGVVEGTNSNRSIKGIQLQYVEDYRKFQVEFQRITEIIKRFLQVRTLERFIVLHKEPPTAFEEVLKKIEMQWHVVKPEDAEEIIIQQLTEKVRNGQTEMAVLIIDKSIMEMQAKLSPILQDFSKVLLFSEINPFEHVGNVTHYNIMQYMIKRR